MKIKGAIFDMDGTLIDSLFFFDAFWQEIGERYLGDRNFRPEEALDKRVRTAIFSEALRMIAEEYHITDPSFVDEYVAYLENFYRYKVSPKAGAIALLSDLRAQGIPICVASASGLEKLYVALTAAGLRELIDRLHSCEEVGVGKERPDVFLLAAKTMGFAPAQVCVFEDSFLALETAKAAGFRTVGVYDAYGYEQERLRAASDIYLGKGASLADLIGQLQI